MRTELLPDDLWDEVRGVLPPPKACPRGGRPRVDDRVCLRALIFIDRSGIPYHLLPADVFGVSGPTCWRRLRDWTLAGVWAELHRRLLNHLGRLGRLDPSRVVVDAQAVRAVFGGRTPGRVRSTAARTASNAT